MTALGVLRSSGAGMPTGRGELPYAWSHLLLLVLGTSFQSGYFGATYGICYAVMHGACASVLKHCMTSPEALTACAFQQRAHWCMSSSPPSSVF